MGIPYVERTIRIKTRQFIVGKQRPADGLPLREWQVDLWILTLDGLELPANVFEKCTYRLHPTFPQPIQIKTEPPFTVKERGWGEFSYPIQCSFLQGGGEVEFLHDLSFQESTYHSDVPIKVPIHIPDLRKALEISGAVLSTTDALMTESTCLPKIDRSIKKLVAGDEDLATDVMNKILHHPAISREIEKLPLEEQFVFDLRQLPSCLLEEVIHFIDQSEQ
ncbi:LAME_0F04412g1_1 [Lachancea meyersii CBS 8951]|uniref:LAME_0F04412g1_1 n=1 Tax=Lachancea meyersii CBS 8951 TaxID=1266667 RepID=A0A1G4JS07_9SACH|nr:LAME_0F04412g1_1 [Lachancea meyersii CBS 8951]